MSADRLTSPSAKSSGRAPLPAKRFAMSSVEPWAPWTSPQKGEARAPSGSSRRCQLSPGPLSPSGKAPKPSKRYLQEYLSQGFSLQVLGIFLVGCVRSAIPVRRSKRQDSLAQRPDPAFSKIDREIC